MGTNQTTYSRHNISRQDLCILRTDAFERGDRATVRLAHSAMAGNAAALSRAADLMNRPAYRRA